MSTSGKGSIAAPPVLEKCKDVLMTGLKNESVFFDNKKVLAHTRAQIGIYEANLLQFKDVQINRVELGEKTVINVDTETRALERRGSDKSDTDMLKLARAALNSLSNVCKQSEKYDVPLTNQKKLAFESHKRELWQIDKVIKREKELIIKSAFKADG